MVRIASMFSKYCLVVVLYRTAFNTRPKGASSGSIGHDVSPFRCFASRSNAENAICLRARICSCAIDESAVSIAHCHKWYRLENIKSRALLLKQSFFKCADN